MRYLTGRGQVARYMLSRPVLYFYMRGRLAWEYIKSYFFFTDGYSEKFEDGYICKFEDQ